MARKIFKVRFFVCILLMTFSIQSAYSAELVAPNSENPSELKWAAILGSNQTQSNYGKATERFVNLRYRSEMGSVSVEELELQRYGSKDRALAIDTYPKLWEGAYANFRYQASDTASLYPNSFWRAEVFQNMDGGWEISTGYDRLNFDSSVVMKSMGLGHYWRNFYARLRHQTVTSNSSTGKGDRMMVRYYYLGDADNYFEVNFSRGQSIEPANYALIAINSNSNGVAFQHFLNHIWGFKISASQAKDTSFLKNQETSANISATYRWK